MTLFHMPMNYAAIGSYYITVNYYILLYSIFLLIYWINSSNCKWWLITPAAILTTRGERREQRKSSDFLSKH